ncbi:MAG: xanthine dehydrogenase accessory protein XdhC [Betaproteobacteria bacterium]
MRHIVRLLKQLALAPAVLVTVDAVRGSVPREPGAWMAVFADQAIGTIGGGHLEFEALREARERLCRVAASAGSPLPQALPDPGALRRFVLGPSLGQCCGGEVQLRFEPVTVADAALLQRRLAPALVPVALFGGGHVGQALARVLAELPLAVHWIDSRDGVFPSETPGHVSCEHSDPVQGAVPTLAAGSRVLIMSFSHAEDLDVVAACLKRQRQRADLPFIGLIGSQTKWATFRHRLQERGFSTQELAQVTCPIGLSGIVGKQPEVIAVAVAAQILQTLTA